MDNALPNGRGPKKPQKVSPSVEYDYDWMVDLSRIGWAWEFLRRNPEYRKQSVEEKDTVNSGDWGLRRFEDHTLDARKAEIFWLSEACTAVLPVRALPLEGDGKALNVSQLKCGMGALPAEDGRSVDILFHHDCRFLQISVTGAGSIVDVQLLAAVVPMPKHSAARVLALRRFANLVTSGTLQPNLYPPERRAPRLTKVLQALDCWLAQRTYRDIALLMYGAKRVDAEWNDPRDNLRDQVRRAVYYGRTLMNGGYRQFLR
jgi:hypothetical protein